MSIKHTLEVEWEQVEHIICAELTWDLNSVLQSIEHVKETGKGFVYSLDAKEDLEELEVVAYALAIVLKHYGGFNAN